MTLPRPSAVKCPEGGMVSSSATWRVQRGEDSWTSAPAPALRLRLRRLGRLSRRRPGRSRSWLKQPAATWTKAPATPSLARSPSPRCCVSEAKRSAESSQAGRPLQTRSIRELAWWVVERAVRLTPELLELGATAERLGFQRQHFRRPALAAGEVAVVVFRPKPRQREGLARASEPCRFAAGDAERSVPRSGRSPPSHRTPTA